MLLLYSIVYLLSFVGISNCPDWQADFAQQLSALSNINSKHATSVFYNPRRPGQISLVGDIAQEQIMWEHQHLGKVNETHRVAAA